MVWSSLPTVNQVFKADFMAGLNFFASYYWVGLDVQWDFPGGMAVKNQPSNTGDSRDMGLISRSKRHPGLGTHSIILAWKILWTEEPGRLQSFGLQSWA